MKNNSLTKSISLVKSIKNGTNSYPFAASNLVWLLISPISAYSYSLNQFPGRVSAIHSFSDSPVCARFCPAKKNIRVLWHWSCSILHFIVLYLANSANSSSHVYGNATDFSKLKVLLCYSLCDYHCGHALGWLESGCFSIGLLVSQFVVRIQEDLLQFWCEFNIFRVFATSIPLLKCIQTYDFGRLL